MSTSRETYHAGKTPGKDVKKPAMKFLLFTLLCFFVLQANAQSPFPPGAKADTVANGFQFVEGPVWSDSLGLLFSDIPGNTVYQWRPGEDTVVFLRPSDNSNGLTFDLRGRLLLAQTGLRRVARLESDGSETPLAVTYRGKKLNSPNDLVVKSDGSIFFTDPPFNIPAGQRQELPFSGIFRITPSGVLQLLDSTLVQPNGICFSRDESKLYVNNSSERVIYVWDVVDDSIIVNKRPFASMKPSGYADGMKLAPNGDLVSAGPLGIWVFSPGGAILDTILIPQQTANCAWGDPDRKTLYITASHTVYRIRATFTSVDEDGSLVPAPFRLFHNYPNPWNPSTTIPYHIAQWSGAPAVRVSLMLYDILGRKIATMVDTMQRPGDYNVRVSAGQLNSASGIYVYRLTVAGTSQTFTMALLK
jgi:gluconolactonase